MSGLSHATCRAVICCRRAKTPPPPETIDEGRRRETRTSRARDQHLDMLLTRDSRDPRSMRGAVDGYELGDD